MSCVVDGIGFQRNALYLSISLLVVVFGIKNKLISK